VLAAVLVELAVVAIITPLTRWNAISANLSGVMGVRRLDTVRLIVTFIAPIVLAVAWAAFAKRLRSAAPAFSSPHRGYAEAGILTTAFFLMAYQGWFASHLGLSEVAHASRELMLRAGTIFAGMVMAIQGNFTCKAPAPSGPGAPDPAAWTQVKSRSGWTLSLAGITIAVCAIVLPLDPLVAALVLLGLSAIGYVAVQNQTSA
jgi:hypothetical protein